MAKWVVRGADRVSGEDKTIIVEGPSANDVERVYGRSMLISEVTSADAPIRDQLPAAAATAIVRKPPDYGSITTGATVLRLIGIIAILVGGLATAFGLMTMASKESSMEKISSANAIIAGVGAILYGVFALFVAGLGEAIRDIARNSFRR